MKSGEVEAVVRVTGKNTELGKIIQTIANTMESRNLVPGDLAKLTLGGLIRADGEVLDGKLIQVDTSQMTGESLPVTMLPWVVANERSELRMTAPKVEHESVMRRCVNCTCLHF